MRAGYGRVVVTGMGIVTACGAGKEINRIKILSGESAVPNRIEGLLRRFKFAPVLDVLGLSR
jgi:hypothetical protein